MLKITNPGLKNFSSVGISQFSTSTTMSAYYF